MQSGSLPDTMHNRLRFHHRRRDSRPPSLSYREYPRRLQCAGIFFFLFYFFFSQLLDDCLLFLSFFWASALPAFPSLVLVPFLLACSLACRPCCDAPLLLLLFFTPLICSHLFRCLRVLLLLILFMTSYFCLLFFDAGFTLPRTRSACQLVGFFLSFFISF